MLSRTRTKRQCPWTHLIGSYTSVAFLQSSGNHTTSLTTQCEVRVPPRRLCFELSFNNGAYNDLLLLATRKKSLVRGKLVHGHMIKVCFRPCLFVENNLLNMYCKCGDTETAHILFDRMPRTNVISWNLLISGYSQMGPCRRALDLFVEARNKGIKPDRFTYASVLSVCSQSGDLRTGMMIHGLVEVSGIRHQVFLINSLIDMYANCGFIDVARFVFDRSDELDEVSWNSLISSYVQIGLVEESLKLFVRMHQCGVQINSFALGSVFKACASCSHAHNLGAAIQGCVVKVGQELDVVVCGAMLDMYVKHGALEKAIKIFKLMPERNVIVFNAMIAGLCGSEVETFNEPVYALNLFSEMERGGMKPTKFTFSSALRACNLTEAFELGKQIHAQVLKHNLQKDEFIGSGLIDLYSDSGLIEDGLRCFHSMLKQDVVSWTSMISGFVQNELFEQACSLFHKLLVTGQNPDEFTISSVLSACANLATAKIGEQIHSYSVKAGLNQFIVCVNSQIFMYAKSGDIDAAAKTFAETCHYDVVTWSAMISSYAQHGCAEHSLSLFKKMKDHGFAPNSVTFLGILTACSHGGLLNEGLRFIDSMERDYNLTPNVRHSACIVDLLGRAGKLADAEGFIMDSGFDFDPVIWKALLGSCRLYGDIDRGTRAAGRIMELEPQESASYVLLYNMYLDSGEQLLADNIRDQMKRYGVKKEPGLSWIEIGAVVHSFVAGDKSHRQSKQIYAKLEAMVLKIKEVHATSAKKQKPHGSQKLEILVNFHSERLAVALGMLALPESALIRVMKNLRVCRDCHTVIKLFSESERREIVLRDPIRFHRFSGGSCSYGDYTTRKTGFSDGQIPSLIRR